jgi:hypothetical protein
MQPNGKDTVYVDVDDEITTIIDKVTGSKQKIVALVLPKRAAVLQSVVNMKLLKRSADNANKNVVLVTTESALMPLAGAAGLHVAKTPTSKPEIPVSPLIHDGQVDDEDETLDLEDEDAEYTAENSGSKPVGDLAKSTSAGAGLGAAPSAIETVTLDNEEPVAEKDDKKPKGKKSKEPKIPNFSRFQKQLAIGAVLLVALLVGLYFALFVLPKATIAISTDATDYNSNLSATLDSGASDVDLAKGIIPATIAQQQKTYTQEVAATGEQNNGDKASGKVDMTARKCSGSGFSASVPAGTGISANGKTFITQETADFSPYDFQDGCVLSRANNISVTAQKGGVAYNLKDATFTVAGRSDVSATGTTTGGTDDIVKVVSQKDIDGAKDQINTEDTSSIKEALAQQLRSNNLYPVQASFITGTPNVSSSANAGQPADDVTVTISITYTMYGSQRKYLDDLIQNDIKQQIDPTTQAILDDGLDRATIKLTGNNDTTADISLATTATVGPKLDVGSLKEQIKGKKSGYVKSLIGNQPGVTNVTVKLSPFWVGSVPTKGEKITITVGKANAEQ